MMVMLQLLLLDVKNPQVHSFYQSSKNVIPQGVVVIIDSLFNCD